MFPYFLFRHSLHDTYRLRMCQWPFAVVTIWHILYIYFHNIPLKFKKWQYLCLSPRGNNIVHIKLTLRRHEHLCAVRFRQNLQWVANDDWNILGWTDHGPKQHARVPRPRIKCTCWWYPNSKSYHSSFLFNPAYQHDDAQVSIPTVSYPYHCVSRPLFLSNHA